MTDATQHCAAAREHSEDAVNQIRSAVDTVAEQITQLNGVISDLNETLSLIEGTRTDAIDLAASHMQAVKDAVGSTTAEEIANGYRYVSEMLSHSPISGIKQAIQKIEEGITAASGSAQSMDSDITELERLKGMTSTLASILGA